MLTVDTANLESDQDDIRIIPEPSPRRLAAARAAINSCIDFASRGFMENLMKVVDEIYTGEEKKTQSQFLDLARSTMEFAYISLSDQKCLNCDASDGPILQILQIVEAGVDCFTPAESRLIAKLIATSVAAGFGRD